MSEAEQTQEIAESQVPSEAEKQKNITSDVKTTAPTKNPKRVAAGKMVAERTRQNREAQKKAAEKANMLFLENQKNSAKQEVSETNESFLTTSQWISIIGIAVTVITTYFRPEYFKGFFSKDTEEKKEEEFKHEPITTVFQPKQKNQLRPMD